MTVDTPEPQPADQTYRCPGEQKSISRAVHLGRLARFYAACRECPHREETGSLSPRLVKRLAETERGRRARPLWDGAAFWGVYLNDLTPATARQLAVAMGLHLLAHRPQDQAPVVLVAGDGRSLAPELLAAASDGLRWPGCNVVDAGASSGPCLAFAVHHLEADGGLLVGNPGDRPETVGLRCWMPGPEPLASTIAESIVGQLDSAHDRPTRKSGSARGFQAEVPYLSALGRYYHALRPLRLVVSTSCPPVRRYLEKLTSTVDCEVLPCPAPARLPEQIVERSAHLGAGLADDGQRLHLWDECGRPVPAEDCLEILTAYLLAEQPDGVVVLEEETSAAIVESIRRLGARVVLSGSQPARMYAACRGHRAIFGGGPRGAFWPALDGHAAPDGLLTLTLLLGLLSRDDRPLSQWVAGRRD